MKPRQAAPSHAPLALLGPKALALAALGMLGACHASHDDDDDFVVVSSNVEVEPNNQSISPNFLGVLRPGEVIVVEGVAAAAPLDEFDGFAIALVQPTEIEFTLFFDDFTGELDAWVYDPAIADFALFFESDFSPESGVFVVDEPVLDFQLVVRAFTGQADYRLEIAARPAPIFSTSESAGERLWRGAIEPAAGWPQVERTSPAARRAARERYLGREVAGGLESIREPELEEIGVLIALPDPRAEDGESGAEAVVLPIQAAPGRAPRVVAE